MLQQENNNQRLETQKEITWKLFLRTLFRFKNVITYFFWFNINYLNQMLINALLYLFLVKF